ncbi:MAG TPA: glycosyltransferase family 2 protein [Ignavibacteria bacterium]|nr:glycosyltransferase family 2 protein [Ignavibacteria bacterium]
MQSPTVSVIIPLYNRRKYIISAVDSVLMQTYKNFEIIIVDDGSTDNVEKTLFPILKSHENIQYIRQSNSGPASALDKGIKIASGEYITFLDSDDEYKKDHIKKRINYFKNNPKTDLTYSTAEIIGKEEDMFVPDARNKKKLIHLNDCIIGGTFFGKIEVFQKLNGFKNIYAYDYDFFNRAKKKFKVVKLEMPTYIYNRNTPDSLLTNLKKKQSV